jgi:hypothetical protein
MKIGPSPFTPGAGRSEPEHEHESTARTAQAHGHHGPRHAERRSARPPGPAPSGGKNPLRPRRPPPRRQAGTDALAQEADERELPAPGDDLRLRAREQAGESEDHPGRGEDERARQREQARRLAGSPPGAEPAMLDGPGRWGRGAGDDGVTAAPARQRTNQPPPAQQASLAASGAAEIARHRVLGEPASERLLAAALRAAINQPANATAGARPAHSNTNERIRRVMSAFAGAPAKASDGGTAATLERVKQVLIESAAAAAAGESPTPAQQNLNALLPLMLLTALQPRTAEACTVAHARREALDELTHLAPAKLPPRQRS